MKIRYKNVCSIKEAEVEFKPGQLVCIKGESNQGKSALFYSLLAGLTNSPEFKHFINHEALQENSQATAWIGLYDDKGNLFQVEAGTGHFNYRVNEAKYEKVKRKSIFEVIEGQIPGLFYDPEELGQILSIRGEDSGMFPIDRSDAQIFKTYERLLSLSCTEDILRTIKLDLEDVDYKSSDMLTAVQKQQEQLAKVEEFYANTDLSTLDKIKSTLLSYKTILSRILSLHDRTIKIATYVQETDKVEVQSTNTFNTRAFEKLLIALTKASNDLKYITLCSFTYSSETFSTTKVSAQHEVLAKVRRLEEELSTLNTSISADTIELEGIKNSLKDIKTCPLCQKPMEN